MLSVQTGDVSILREKSALSASVMATIASVDVQNEINMPAMFSFTMSMMSAGGNWQGANLDTFKPGDEITIKMGLNSLQTLIVGEITAIEPRFGVYSTATIRGFDRMYRLKFGNDTRVFENLSDNDIVSQVARAAGVAVNAQGTRTQINSYVQQRRQNNYQFLLKRSGQINHELIMDGTTLMFRPSAEGKSPVKTLTFPRDVDSVDLDLRIPTQGSSVTVRSFDPSSNQAISATSRSGGVQERMGGKENGYQMAGDFPDSAITLEQLSITSVEALQVVADAQYQANLDHFIEGSATLVGDPDLTAGVNVRLSGLSQRFDGVYYVTASTHSYDDTKGYNTSLRLRRTGA